jgi:integrase
VPVTSNEIQTVERREGRRRPNKELRTREHLTPSEVEELMSVARQRGRNGHRDATMILIAYRHGMRPSELVDLRWDQVDLKAGELHVRRRNNGKPATHPLRGDELRALRKLQREAPASPYVFVSEHGTPISVHGWQKLVERIGQAWNVSKGTELKVHAHMLRHALPWRMRATIRGRSRIISGTSRSSTRCATPSCRRIGSRTSGSERMIPIKAEMTAICR